LRDVAGRLNFAGWLGRSLVQPGSRAHRVADRYPPCATMLLRSQHAGSCILSDFLQLMMKEHNFGSVEIPDLTSIPEILDEPVFDGYRKGGFSPLVRDGGHEKIPMVSSLCRSGGGEAPKNVMKNDDFYRAIIFKTLITGGIPYAQMENYNKSEWKKK